MLTKNMRLPYFPSETQELLLKASILDGEQALTAYNEWTSKIDINSLDAGSIRLLPLCLENLQKQNIHIEHEGILKGIFRRNYYKNQLLTRKLAELILILQEEQTKTIILKGAALLVQGHFNYGSRPMEDVDLLIPKEKTDETISLLLKLGWTCRYKEIEKILESKHAALFVDPTGYRVDLHWRIFPQSMPDETSKTFWEGAVPVKVHEVATLALNQNDLLMHICAHGARWNTVPSLRWVSDAMAVLSRKNQPIDWSRMISQTKKYQLGLPLGDSLTYLKKEFSAPVPEEFFVAIQQFPVTKQMIKEYRTFSRENKAFDNIEGYWFSYLKGRKNANFLSTLFGFIDYLTIAWKKKNAWGVIAHLANWLRNNMIADTKKSILMTPMLGNLYSLYRRRKYGEN